MGNVPRMTATTFLGACCWPEAAGLAAVWSGGLGAQAASSRTRADSETRPRGMEAPRNLLVILRAREAFGRGRSTADRLGYFASVAFVASTSDPRRP